MDARATFGHEDVLFHFPDGTGAWAGPLTPQGMYLRTMARLHVGECLSVQLPTAVRDLVVTARGYVVIVHGCPGGLTEAAVRFTELRVHHAS
jgi:Tfp pilus assembly ATPase PilU